MEVHSATRREAEVKFSKARKPSVSSARGGRRAESAKRTKNSRIDFSDIPDSTPEELARAVRVGRPATGNAKQLIALRIAPSLLSKIRRLAAKKDTPYQTLLHDLLEEAVGRKAA